VLLKFEKDAGDNIQFAGRANVIAISVEEPWAGSTETGFGYHCSICINKDEAAILRDFLNKWLAPNTLASKAGAVNACQHKNRSGEVAQGRTMYEVCMDCGKRLDLIAEGDAQP
jgi:hypothetical protein